jgi:hypothetical protein
MMRCLSGHSPVLLSRHQSIAKPLAEMPEVPTDAKPSIPHMMLMFQKLNWTKSMFFAHFCLEMIAR